ncbi:general stress protein [uncultured Marinococcus sp.]|uniref:general stress protein n=1 Tax=uncultured Marinococcus sp. TaxID=487012 RepID=UPI0026119ABD|nr:general stress protein [uncultured Marinococcus sp.]
MKPYVREYTNDEQIQHDVQTLANKGIDRNDMYVMSHDDDRTNRIAGSVHANEPTDDELNVDSANRFSKKGDELRYKLQELGFSSQEAEDLEDELDEGKVLLMVQGDRNPDELLK